MSLLLQGLSDAQVAGQLGVDRGTVFRWRKDRKFAAELCQLRQAMLERTMSRVQSMLEPALDIIQRQIDGDDPKTALRAATLLLRIAAPPRQRLEPDPDAAPSPGGPMNDFDRMLAFVNAPMPDDPEYPAYMARLNGEDLDQELEDDDPEGDDE